MTTSSSRPTRSRLYAGCSSFGRCPCTRIPPTRRAGSSASRSSRGRLPFPRKRKSRNTGGGTNERGDRA
jgi:hypothetical protein